MLSSDYEKFHENYKKMDNSMKWTLDSGTIVEDALYNFGLQCTNEQ